MKCETCIEAECPGCHGKYCDNCGPTVYVWSPYKPTREEFERLRKLYDERKQDLRFVTTRKRNGNS